MLRSCGEPMSRFFDAAHRVHAQVEDCVRTRQRHRDWQNSPSTSFAFNQAWLAASLAAATLLAWLKLLAFDSDLAKADPRPCATASCTLPPG